MTKTVIGQYDPSTANGVSAPSPTPPPHPTTESRSTINRVEHRRRRRHRSGDKSRLTLMRLAKMTGLKKMLAVMSEECSSGGGGSGGGTGEQCRDVTQDFLTTGRVGRRNALPDILGEHARLSTAGLPDQMSCLSVTEDASKSQSPSSSQSSSSSAAPSGSTQPKS